MTKRGTGRLFLTHANTYSGGTIVERGALVIKNRRGSGTGSGPVQVNRGRLGGSGIIAGAVTIGSGSERGAFLSPKMDEDGPLTIQSHLTFNSDGTYAFGVNSDNGTADEVIANGVTIASGAQFLFNSLGAAKLARGTIFIAISNMSASPISGTFRNLPDGLTFTNGANTYRVDYQGGDGNDLTFTVQ